MIKFELNCQNNKSKSLAMSKVTFRSKLITDNFVFSHHHANEFTGITGQVTFADHAAGIADALECDFQLVLASRLCISSALCHGNASRDLNTSKVVAAPVLNMLSPASDSAEQCISMVRWTEVH